MSGFEVLDRSNATQVEGVLTHTAVAGSWPLAARDVREGMLDGNALA